ncbi:hypothetical protein Hypma_006353 [Hypsizygus marmoreus]|uniref:Uncharacterized protein n=1 Tax=Hypsizygus marmoreus TaxID=39966 RepID=A0A369JVW4_HYPMA|nr:hypothetical protein Hypma_006353 [Hypsizygus marmoreus]
MPVKTVRTPESYVAVQFTPIIREPYRRSRAVVGVQRPSMGFEDEKAKLHRRIAELEKDLKRANWKLIVAQEELDDVSEELEEVKDELEDVNDELDDANHQLQKVTTKLGKMTLKSNRLALDKILLEKENDMLFAERDIFVSWQINCLVV